MKVTAVILLVLLVACTHSLRLASHIQEAPPATDSTNTTASTNSTAPASSTNSTASNTTTPAPTPAPAPAPAPTPAPAPSNTSNSTAPKNSTGAAASQAKSGNSKAPADFSAGEAAEFDEWINNLIPWAPSETGLSNNKFFDEQLQIKFVPAVQNKIRAKRNNPK